MGRHVITLVVIIIIVIVVGSLRRRLPQEPVPLLPPTMLLQGVPSSHPLASPGLLRVLFSFFFSAATLRAARSTASSGTGGRAGL
jgi:hypothetical protein